MSRNTVGKHLRERKPSSYARKRRVSILDPYKEYVTQQIEKYDLSAIRILEDTSRYFSLSSLNFISLNLFQQSISLIVHLLARLDDI